ncbi:hypothetical protein [Natrinema soli]|uniref:Uncharacterized protein n=1 Tax=Natrinema soli TaxID=1930624 RepID=A0ABD5SG99_9EURY|nr:hypothetical protein [Natrinema soli]
MTGDRDLVDEFAPDRVFPDIEFGLPPFVPLVAVLFGVADLVAESRPKLGQRR